MSKDPNTNPPPKGAKPETLEDVVYRASLTEGNKAIRHASPWVSIPLTLVTWVGFGSLTYVAATQTKMGQAVVKKTIGIDLTEAEGVRRRRRRHRRRRAGSRGTGIITGTTKSAGGPVATGRALINQSSLVLLWFFCFFLRSEAVADQACSSPDYPGRHCFDQPGAGVAV